MDFADNLSVTCGPARAAMDTMARHGIPAHPVNFSIWYAYHGSGNTAYRRALDLLLANGAALTEARCEAIFLRHFGPSNGTGLGGRPAKAPASPTHDETTAELVTLVHDVRRKTRRVADKTRALERWLARTARHIAHSQDRTEATPGGALSGSWTDCLTGLANRACFEAQLCGAIAAVWRSRGALSLVVADIDRFTAFNRRYGRTLGDEALHALAAAVRGMAHGGDMAARIDGNAFAIIRPGAGLEAAAALGENLRRRLASCKLVNCVTGESYGRLTASVGVARYHLGEPAGDLVRRAEQALHQAKGQGRNRVSAQAPASVESARR